MNKTIELCHLEIMRRMDDIERLRGIIKNEEERAALGRPWILDPDTGSLKPMETSNCQRMEMQKAAELVAKYQKPKRSIAEIRSEMEQVRGLMCEGMSLACIFNPLAALQLSTASGRYEALKVELRKAESFREKERAKLQQAIANLQIELARL